MDRSVAITLMPFAFLLVSYLLVAAGVAKKRLTGSRETCPVCHREQRSCTCRWL